MSPVTETRLTVNWLFCKNNVVSAAKQEFVNGSNCNKGYNNSAL